MRLRAFYVNGMKEERKRGELAKEFKDGTLDVLGIQETFVKSVGEGKEQENKMWEGL